MLSLILIPLTGILVIWLFTNKKEEIYITGLIFGILHLIQSQFLYHNLDLTTSEFQYKIGKLGIDSLSMLLIWLTSLLTVITILSSWKSIKIEIKLMVILLLLVELLTVCVFLVLDILLFYIAYESVLIPLYLMIGIYGSRKRKIQAAYELFLYTLLGSLIMFIAIILIYLECGSTDYLIILSSPISENRQYLLWLAFFISFSIKVPMIPFHIWLPEAHVEAPTVGSVILAGIILKLGGYGFLRYSIPLFPEATIYFRPYVFTLALIGIIYSSISCLAQIDMKKIIAYSSIGHMNTALLGLFSNNLLGISGSIYFMISHGLVSSALFLLIGVLYDRYHTRTLLYYRGLVLALPLFSIFFLLFTLANIAFPSTSSFISELFTFIGSFLSNPILTLIGTISIILTPAYSLWFLHQVTYGTSSSYIPRLFFDITLKEFHILTPLLLLTFYLGLSTNQITQTILFTTSSLLIES